MCECVCPWPSLSLLLRPTRLTYVVWVAGVNALRRSGASVGDVASSLEAALLNANSDVVTEAVMTQVLRDLVRRLHPTPATTLIIMLTPCYGCCVDVAWNTVPHSRHWSLAEQASSQADCRQVRDAQSGHPCPHVHQGKCPAPSRLW